MILDNPRINENIIGSVNCSSLEQTAGTVMNLMTTMGMVNPTTPTNHSSKAVTIKKKGKSYTISISLFTPPLTFTWTGLFPMNEFKDKLAHAIANSKKISYINTVSNASGNRFMQFGLVAG